MDDSRMRLNAEELLAELGWLRRLARSLVGPEGSEDDLVQETWLAASRVDGGVTPAWLVGTLRKLAARFQRTEFRIKRRQGLVAKPEAVEPETLLERNEVFRIVLKELGALDEPFRTTLFLMYQEGMSVKEIAKSLALPVDTIRWRRREALARLRARLDEHGDAGTDWRGAFLPLLTLPSMKPSVAAASLGAAGGTWTYVGGSLMTWKFVSAVALTGIGLWLVALNQGSDGELNPVAQVSAPLEPQIELASVATPAPTDPPGAKQLEERKAIVAPGGPTRVLTAPSEVALSVSVVDRLQHPVAGARVWIGDAPDPGEQSWLSDELGVAQVPLSVLGKVNVLSGMTGELYGTASYLPQVHGEAYTLRLYPDADVLVQVVNEAGEPLEAVPVGIVRRGILVGRDELPSLTFTKTVRTNAEGLAVIRHVRGASMYMGKDDGILVGPAVLLKDRPDVKLDGLSLPSEPIRIVLPPTGTLDLQVRESDGAPNRRVEEVRLAIDPTPGARRSPADLHEQLRFSERGILHVQVTDGHGSLLMVGLDLALIAEARKADPTNSTFGWSYGPSAPGASGELVLEPMQIGTEVVGTLQAENGSPLANRPVVLSIVLGGNLERNGITFKTTTDGTGRFRVHVSEEKRTVWKRVSYHNLKVSVAGTNPFEPLTAESDLPELLELGQNDTGVLYCTPATPILHGRAVGTDGAPVQLGEHSLEISIHAESGPVMYRRLDHTQFVTQGNRFALFGPDPQLKDEFGEALFLSGSPENRPWIRQRVIPGKSEVLLRFETNAWLSGSILTEPNQGAVGYVIDFHCRDSAGIERSYGRADFRMDNTFLAHHLPPRRGRFEIRLASSSKLLAAIDNVLPGARGGPQDPRLLNIDLRAKMYSYNLRFVDGQGAPIQGLSLECPGYSNPQIPYEAGLLFLTTTVNPLDVLVKAPGFQVMNRTLSPGKHELTMELGIEVTVQPSPSIQPPAGTSATIVLIGVDHQEELELTALPNGSHVGALTMPGEYAVWARVWRKGKSLADIPFSGQTTIEVVDRSLIQAFELTFNNEAFKQHLPPD